MIIKEYEEKYAKELSEIILSNLYTINIKDHGKALIKKIEEYANQIEAEELLILASVYGCEFYRKQGYDFYKGIRVKNEDGEYILSKNLLKQEFI